MMSRAALFRITQKFLAAVFFIFSTAPALAAETGLLPVEDFFKDPVFNAPTLSPNGRHVAMLLAVKDGRVKLATFDLEKREPKVIGGFDDADVNHFRWVNDDRIVYDLIDRRVAQNDVTMGPGLYAVNRDGSEPRTLVQRSVQLVQERKVLEALPWNTFLFDVERNQQSDEIFVTQPAGDERNNFKWVNLLKLNTKTGKAKPVDIGAPKNTKAWLIDQNNVPRIAIAWADGIEMIHYRDPASDEWRKLGEFDMYTGKGFSPYYFGPDGSFYVSAREKSDISAIYKYDLAKNSIEGEPIVSLGSFDFNGSFVADNVSKKVLGVHFQTDAPSSAWLDAEMGKVQKKVDALLPATSNRISRGRRSETPHLLVEAVSDVQPRTYYLYNRESGNIELLSQSRPWIDAKKMAIKDFVRYKARDGLEIPAYLTRPKGEAKKNLPLIVLVHGGPYLRGGSWGWNADAQFLASRGYAVLEPEFRGSTGFGFKHFKAGWKQWGLSMQDDITDGAKWAIAQGIADPKRICLAGASYGGYATLMGLVKEPELFRCGVNWVGVTDIDLMYTVGWSDFSDEWQRYGMPVLVGDREKDSAQLKATSPLENAAKIKQPLLLAYGGSDRRVPIVHGTMFRDAVKQNNANVEWIEYPSEGHGWALLKTRVDFWTRVEKFLVKNMGKAQ